MRRREKDQFLRREKKDRAVGKRHKNMQSAQLMIDPSPEEPDPHHQRGIDPHERLLEIRAVLFGDLVQTILGNSRSDLVRQRIEIADHGERRYSRCERQHSATIGRHACGRQSHGCVKVLDAPLSPTDERDG